PVNFTFDGNAVVLRTDEGTKLRGARGQSVAYECDDIDRIYHTGWSVLFTGQAEEVRDPTEIERLEQLPIGPGGPGPRSVWMRIQPRTITGRGQNSRCGAVARICGLTPNTLRTSETRDRCHAMH